MLTRIKNIIKKYSPTLRKLEKIEQNQHILQRTLNDLIDIFDADSFFKRDERQVARSVKEIRADHLGRYNFSRQFFNYNVNILDVACGVGYGTSILAESLPMGSITGVDISERAIQYANKYYKRSNNSFKKCDILNLPIDVEKYDGIVSFETIEHITDDKDALKLMFNLLKPNGTFICSVPNEDTIPFSRDNFPYHIRHYRPSEMTKLLEISGFTIKNIYSQHSRSQETVLNNSTGLYLIFHCIKI